MSSFHELEQQIQSGKTLELPAFLREWLSEVKPNWIAGKPSSAGEKFATLCPATSDQLSEVTAATRQEVEEAVKLGNAVFERGLWAKRALKERAAVLHQLADGILKHRAPLAILESLDTGKPIRESFEGDIPRAAQNFQFFANYASAEAQPAYPNENQFHYALREALGVAVLITPWNLPLYLESWKLAPALLMGNSCILKPSELTPLTAAYFAEYIVPEVDLPPGVFSLLHGFGEDAVGEWLVGHPGVSAISFTGETGTGRAIMKAASVGPHRISFEMGGKGATVVFDDADVEAALSVSLKAAFRNQGEICLASPRIFVHRSQFEAFASRFIEKAKQIKVGPPLHWATEMGALISQGHWEKVTRYLQQVDKPARIECGGDRPDGMEAGYYLSPTVVTGLDQKHAISREEIFGPVVSLYPFEEESELIQYVNGTPYGLSASVWTRDIDRAHRVVKNLRAGLVWVNCWFVRDLRVPFGGQKNSGVGREGGRHSLDFFSDWKSVCYQFKEPE